MDKFNIAFDITMKYEGGYSNDPDDVGGETYKGISRKFNPNWPGWAIIDTMKTLPYKDFIQQIDSSVMIQMSVKSLYKAKYWDIFLGDTLKSQSLANVLFDTAVNLGASRAVLFIQKGLNVLNRNATMWEDLVEDGQFGNKTHTVLSQLTVKDTDILVKIIYILRGQHYIDYMKKSPTQEKFARGWFNRIQIN